MSKKHVLVIGAGIVGVSSALWLQRAGHRVTLVDKEGPAAGASFGNAGVVTSGSIVPVAVPGIMRKAPRMLLDPNQPLFLRWRYLPKLLPFLRAYLAHASAPAVERIAEGLNHLLHDAPDQHVALATGTEAEAYIDRADFLYGYADKSAFQADGFGWDIRRKYGVTFTELDEPALSAYDPYLKGRFGYGVCCTGHARIKDPGAYVKTLAASFLQNGGEIVTAGVVGFELQDGQCIGVKTTGAPLIADGYVIAAGAWSDLWRQELGISVPLESERGYHIEFVNPSIELRSTVMVAGGKFVLNSMNGRLRCAGVVEFGGLDAPPSKAPVNLLKRQMAALFPDLTYDRIDQWMGHRPATPDSLPVIGVSPNAANVFLGYGHQHVGLSGGPKTGRWLAKLAVGDPINADLSAFAPNRPLK